MKRCKDLLSPSGDKRISLHCKTAILLCCFAWLIAAIPGSAWVYPEHRNIMVLAVQKLSADRRASLDKIWAMAHTGHSEHFLRIKVQASLCRRMDSVHVPTVWWNNADRNNPIELKTIFGLGLRIAFDWRYYL